MIASSLLHALLAAASTANAYSHAKSIAYSVVTGVFQQDDDATDASTFNFTASNFGLIDRSYPTDSSCPNRTQATQWQRLSHYISTLNQEANKTDRYTLLFMGRHGEGFHNAAESYFGTPAWNCYWSVLDGNSTATWADAKLTDVGEQQANSVKTFWQHLIQEEKITPPETYYTSPLYRCLETAKLTFSGIALPRESPFQPVIKEFLREGISGHTCNRRSSKSYISQNFPDFSFEKGFAEQDPYWMELMDEPRANQDARSKAVLDDIFANDDSTYISITAHSGAISSLLRGTLRSTLLKFIKYICTCTNSRGTVLGHRAFRLSTGSAIPVLLKVTATNGSGPATPTLPYTPQVTCAKPPTIRDSSCNDCSCCL
ncbi:hypothetical protein J1614_010663 [Plenodomus biglobosus]|nr:hypothetical protein J1614_010663 [Plenodomus biglobosus]